MVLSTVQRQRTVIVGAGVGGLTAALALHRVGQASRIVTSDSDMSSSGGAVCLMRSAVNILDRLGLGSHVRCLGLSARFGEVYSSSGKRLFSFDLDEYGGSEVTLVPRPQLRQAFLEALPPNSIAFNTKFKRLDMDEGTGEDRARIMLRDIRAGLDYQVEAERIIGADGGRSAVRSFITRPGASRATGITAFRAVTANCDLETYPIHSIREIWGRDRASLRFGYCRMTPSDVYWWATLNSARPGMPKIEIATAADAKSSGGARVNSNEAVANGGILLRPFGRKLAEHFQEFPFDACELIRGTSESAIQRTEIRSFANTQNPWLDPTGRIVLVGDAARQADLPYLHHGSSMAIEDGYSLAIALDRQAKAGGSRRPLDAFEQERSESTQELHQLWHRFDRLAASRNSLSRLFNVQALNFRLARNNLEGGGLERLHGLDALDQELASMDVTASR